MKTKFLLIQAAVVGVALTCGTALRANNYPTAQTLDASGVSHGSLQLVAFRDRTEAKLLRNAYIILATGDHDYAGHRVNAMQEVKAASDLLGLDLGGDTDTRQPQPLSNEKMREAKSLILQVLDSAEVKGQERVVKHLEGAVHEINTGLGIK